MRFKPGTYTLRELLAPIFWGGKLVYSRPSVMEIQQYCKAEQATLRSESKRLVNPQTIPVDLSQSLYDLKQNLIQKFSAEE